MNSSTVAEMKQRILDKGVRVSDFKVKGLLTDFDIGTIPELTIFNWVSEKSLRLSDFRKWVKIQQNLAVYASYEDE